MITEAEDGVDDHQSGNPTQEEEASPISIDGPKGNQCEDNIHGSGDDDVEEYAGDLISSGREDFLCIVKNDINAAPLLQNGERNAEQ